MKAIIRLLLLTTLILTLAAVISFVVWASTVFAGDGTVSGYVYDSSTTAPIAAARLILKPHYYGYGLHDIEIVTDENGRYYAGSVIRYTESSGGQIAWPRYRTFIYKEGYDDYISPEWSFSENVYNITRNYYLTPFHLAPEKAPPAMIDNFNDGNSSINTVGNPVTWVSSGNFNIEERYLHKYNDGRWNFSLRFSYNMSTAVDYGRYESSVGDFNISNHRYLSFRVKREAGNETCYVKIKYSIYNPVYFMRLYYETGSILISDYLLQTDGWHLASIPLDLAGLDSPQVHKVTFYFDNTLPVKSGALQIDNVEFSNGYSKLESAGQVKIDRETKTLLVSGQPYRIKGVGYQPVPIGAYPPHADDIALYDRDFPILKDMGCNTIRAWGIPGITLLNKAEEYGIKVVGGFWMDQNVDFSNQLVRDSIKQEFTAFVNVYKNSPALLVWALGNENKYNNGSNSYWYSLCNELAKIAYRIEGPAYHPVIIVNGHLFNIGVNEIGAEDLQLNYIDAWGCNIYKDHFTNMDWGQDMRNFFDVFKEKSVKPIIITEYGADAYRTTNHGSLEGYVDEDMQAAWVKQNTIDIIAASDVCLGSTIMAYSDEWWKDWNGSPWTHDKGGWPEGPGWNAYPDGYANEEYWGIVEIASDGTWAEPDGLDDIRKRKVFYTLKGIFVPDTQAPVISGVFPTTGYITTDRKVPFKATIQDNVGLAKFRMICTLHPSEKITGDIYINGVDSGMDYTLSDSGYVNFPTQGLTNMQFEFRPKTAFYVNPAYGSYTKHVYWIGVYDTSGNWTSKATIFYIRQLGGGSGTGDGGGESDSGGGSKTMPKKMLSN